MSAARVGLPTIRLRSHATLSSQGLLSGTARIDQAPAGVTVAPHAALMRELFADKVPRRLDRLSELAVVAAGAAMRPVSDFVPERGGVFFATGQGNFSGTMGYLGRLHEKGARFASPIEFPNLVLSAPAGSLSFQFGLKGEVFAINQSRLSGLQALAVGLEAVRSGRLDVVLVAGAEEQSEGRTRSAQLLGRDPLLGEGAAALVLDGRAQSEGVRVVSLAMNGLPVSDGLVAAAQRCLDDAKTSQVDLIYSHRQHLSALQKFAKDTGARLASLSDHVGDFDVRSMLEMSNGAALIECGEAKRVLVLDADEDSGAACVLLA